MDGCSREFWTSCDTAGLPASLSPAVVVVDRKRETASSTLIIGPRAAVVRDTVRDRANKLGTMALCGWFGRHPGRTPPTARTPRTGSRQMDRSSLIGDGSRSRQQRRLSDGTGVDQSPPPRGVAQACMSCSTASSSRHSVWQLPSMGRLCSSQELVGRLGRNLAPTMKEQDKNKT